MGNFVHGVGDIESISTLFRTKAFQAPSVSMIWAVVACETQCIPGLITLAIPHTTYSSYRGPAQDMRVSPVLLELGRGTASSDRKYTMLSNRGQFC